MSISDARARTTPLEAHPTVDGTLHKLEELAIGDDHESWQSRSRLILIPTAAPSIMGLFGFMTATLMLGAWQAGWYGSSKTPLLIWPFAFVAGGIFQSIAAIVSFRARDGMAVAVHAAWGAFWLAWGIDQLLVATHVAAPIALGSANPSFAFWFIALTLVTAMCTLGALANSASVFVVLLALTGGAAITAGGFWAGSLGALRVGGWFFVISAAAAWITAGAMVLEESFGKTVIPLGKWSKAANVPGRAPSRPIEYRSGMPGARVGQ